MASDTENEELIKKFHSTSSEQLTILTKMHLSFLLNIPTQDTDEPEESNKIFSFFKLGKKKNPNQENSDMIVPDREIGVITILCEKLNDKQYIATEGLFRISGSFKKQREIKHLISSNEAVNFNRYTCHDCATLLKSIISEMPEPLMPEKYLIVYQHLNNLLKMNECGNEIILRAIQLILILIPQANRTIIRKIILILHETHLLERVNKMSAKNLALLFTPLIICSRRLTGEELLKTTNSLKHLIQYMITVGEEIFNIPKCLITDIKSYMLRKDLDSNIDETVANTIYSFLNKKETEEAQAENYTQKALEDLYAVIYNLPKSEWKSKLIHKIEEEKRKKLQKSKSKTKRSSFSFLF